jgi:sugar O-acyltransferase (sialic acid O-acetyltransferase NeuD family)
MNRDIVIFGTGDFAEVATCYFESDSDYRVRAFTCDRGQCSSNTLLGRPVIPFEELANHFPPSAVAGIFVAVGYRRLNQGRLDVTLRIRSIGYAPVSFISTRASLTGPITVGDGVFIFEQNVIQPFASIGDGVVLWSGNHIGHHSVIEDFAFVASHAVIAGRTRIGRQSFVGINATIADHVTVGARNIIGAGTLVTRDTTEDEVYRPARTLPAAIKSHKLWK